MKHLDPAPRRAEPLPRSRKPGKASGATIFLACLAIVGGMGFGMTHYWGDSAGDSISAARRQELAQNFLQIGKVQLEPVAEADINKALTSMNLPLQQAQALKNVLEKTAANPADQTTQLAWLDIWDFAAQDGDVVHLSAAGYEIDVPMLNARTRIAVPIDASNAVVIRGSVDGGGGITLGLQTGAGALLLPVLAPGESLTVPVAF